MSKPFRQKITSMPRQSLLAMKVAFGLRARYISIAATTSFMAIQVVGVLIFTGQAKAITTVVVTTIPATEITPFSAQLNGLSDDVVDSLDATYSFELGTTTGYGTSVAAALGAEVGYQSQFGSAGSGNGQFSGITGIAFDSTGNKYISDYDNNRVQKFNSSNQYLAQWGVSGSGDGEFNHPRAIAVDSNNNIYVADQGNHRIQKFDSSGAYLAQWDTEVDGVNGIPYSLAFDSTDTLYVAGPADRVQKFADDGTYIGKWGASGSGNGQFTSATAIAVDANDKVYVTETGNNRVQKFETDGTYITKWGTSGTGNSQFSSPYGIAVDSAGSVYVADTFNNRVQKFTATGTYVGKFGSAGSGNGQFNYPTIISIDDQGIVYVADGNRFQIFAGLYHADASDLACGTDYHYRAKAVAGSDTVYGEDQTFTTTECFAITTTSLVDGAVDVDYAQAVVTNRSSATISLSSGTLPPGLSINGSGHIMGTPTQAGTFEFTVEASDTSDDGPATDSQNLSITITQDQAYEPLVITTDSLGDGVTGVDYAEFISTNSSMPVTFSTLSGSLPDGLQLSNDGVVNGIPTTTGSFSFVVKATDGTTTDSQDFTIGITGQDEATEEEGPDISVIESVLPFLLHKPDAPLVINNSPGAKVPTNALFALAQRIPEPIALGLPWLLLILALVLVNMQYYQVRSESLATKRLQLSVANQERLIEEQNNFVALTTHYLHTPLTVMEGEIALMVKAGTMTQETATKLRATLTSLSAEAEAVLAQEEQDKVE